MDEDYKLIIKQIIKHIHDRLIELGINSETTVVYGDEKIVWTSPKGAYRRKLWLDGEANIIFECDSFATKSMRQTFDIRDPQSIQKAIETFCS